jgi:hypothetical protein
MEAKFTPGPWTVVQTIATKNPNMGAWSVDSGPANVANYCTLADASLIAAAPDLFEALRDCLGWHDFADDLHKPIEVRAAYMRARAALAKALGRSTESEGA